MLTPKPKGEFHRPTWESWSSLRRRCFDEKYKEYRYWVTEVEDFEKDVVCPQWETYEGFLADMGERPDGKFLIRLNYEKGYYPANCAWESKGYHARAPKAPRLDRRVKTAVTWDTVWRAMR